ncbi:MAG: mobile mystery protein B [Bacteriovoracaceae bacterium]|nr:mobile mystery protein B [Bacteriovoracaceae bacterium]
MSIFFNDRAGNTPLSLEEKQGIKLTLLTTMDELDIVEMENIQKGIMWLQRKKLSQPEQLLNMTFSNTFHKKLFGDVWKWAGKLRTSEKNIGVAPCEISIKLHDLFEDVMTWIRLNSYADREILARFHHRLVLIHPYTNGNGRHSRLMTDALAELLIGSDLSWYEEIEKNKRRKKYIDVLRQADIRNYTPLVNYFLSMKTKS